MRRAVGLALLVTAACHTTMRSRTTPAGNFVEEEGTCLLEDVGPQERCTEEERFDEKNTVLVGAAVVVALVVAGLVIGASADPSGK
jgi:hypothetical protein